jgi:SAM-dependent methyltransferase
MIHNETAQCRICGSESKLIVKDLEGYIKGQRFDIFRCNNCDTHFVGDDDFDMSVYQHIYAQADKVPGYNRYYKYASEILNHPAPMAYLAANEAMYWAVQKAIEQYHIPYNADILEVGCGLGYLTYALRKAGYNCKGLDIAQNAVDEATKRFGDYYMQGNIFLLNGDNDPKYDLIILTEVIEHVENPKAFAACLLKLLKKGGKIIITTPNKSVGDQHNPWSSELPPVHLSWFSEKSALKLAEVLSAKISFIDFTAFNRSFFDKMRFIFYKPQHFQPVLDATGCIIHPVNTQVPGARKKLENFVWQIVLKLSNCKPFYTWLTRKEYPIDKNNTLAFMLEK